MAQKKIRNTYASHQSAFSLIEVLIFTALIAIVLIGMSYVTLLSVRGARFSEDKTKALRYGQQLQEWLRGQKELQWNTFVSSLSEQTYCVNTLPSSMSDFSALEGVCATHALASKYKRELTIDTIAADGSQVSFTITVFWNDGGSVQRATVSSAFSVLE
ncbi:MAG: hypothetical protein UZ21_OP11001001156 [Microgenomates bacterium OLB22]|nr:MAG: hypothetical protein UZ21_OP11001001156 [Microgenomates bacterium OLB22]